MRRRILGFTALAGIALHLGFEGGAHAFPAIPKPATHAVIVGSLSQGAECAPSDRRNPQVWLSIGNTLLYQVEVPASGSYELHVLPGKYDLVATNSAGCLDQKSVEVRAKQVSNIPLALAKAPARAGGRGASLLPATPWVFAWWAFYLTPVSAGIGLGCGTMCFAQMQGFCPTCGPTMAQGMMPWGMPSPWWWNTGPMMYSNFYSPAPFSYGPGFPGVMPGYFPGGGGVYMAKPNLYLEGPVGTSVSVRLRFQDAATQWLAAIPAHGAQGWQVTLADRNKVRAGEATYGFLYSDYRIDEKGMQDEAGFCADRKEVVSKMALALREAKFSGREIADFIEFWSVKLPASKRFCVYPQDERQLDALAPLDITPKPVALRRVVFVVQVSEGLVASDRRFTSEPKSRWAPAPIRLPASAETGIVAREWGVAFLAAGK